MGIKRHLAVDIGASGGRHILGWLEDGIIHTEEVHRFPNGMIQTGEQLCWDIEALHNEVIAGLKKCAETGRIPDSVGIDTWGVDFVFLDKDGNLVGPTIAYRDSRTDGMDLEVSKFISESDLYARAGIQKMFFNSIYQLMAVKTLTPEYFDVAEDLLFMPDYLHYKLCGVKKNEYTIASTSALVNAKLKIWDDEIIKRCGFPKKIFGEIVPAGTILGGFTDEIKNSVGFDCKVIMPPSHDTASAFLAVPAKSDKSVYISSGTWSLMGVELTEPITTETSHLANFTNEGGYDYRYRYLKNIAGLWLLQCIHKEIGNNISYTELVDLARASDCDSVFDVNDERFAAPESMVSEICDACRKSGQMVPQSLGDFARVIFRSLAVCYADTKRTLEELTGIKFECINIIGGGSQNEYLNQLTANECGVTVYAGPTEGTALGNITCQMISMGVLPDINAARDAIRRSFEIREVNHYA
ncbi:MAG: rhamnulokinase [Oscillospiraceae bacterium]|nr:rhamnulokinase [Oscillospiraceae bacterium]